MMVATIVDAPLSDVLSLFLINLISQALCAEVHNICNFVIGLSYWSMHLGHYLFTFLILSVGCVLGLLAWPSKSMVPVRRIIPLALTAFGTTAVTAILYDQIPTSAIVCIRMTDFAVTLIMLSTAKYFIDKNFYCARRSNMLWLVVIIAICSSLAWLEFIKGLNYKIILVWPFLPIFSALHFMLAFQTYQELKISFLSLTMYICGITGILTLPFALMFPIDTTEKTRIITNSLELIDYVVLTIGFFSFFTLKVTEYGLMCKCVPETFAVVRHSGYTVGALAHIFIRAGMLIPVFGILSKFVAVGLILLYCWRRRKSETLNAAASAKQYVAGHSAHISL